MSFIAAAYSLAAIIYADMPGGGGAIAPPGIADKLNTLLGWASYLGFGMCVIGLTASGGLLAVSHRRGQSGEHVAGIGYAIAGSIIIGAAATLIKVFAT
jgi:hypothetical protein